MSGTQPASPSPGLMAKIASTINLVVADGETIAKQGIASGATT